MWDVISKINGINDGRVTRITNSMQCSNNNLNEAMQKTWENQHWPPTSCKIKVEACGYRDEVRI
jgi:hypothetical protein